MCNIGRTVSFDLYEGLIPDSSGEEESSNSLKREHMARLVKRIIGEELSEKQRKVLAMYYFNRMTMPEIAAELSINKSSVSRCLARGIKQISDRVKYYKLR